MGSTPIPSVLELRSELYLQGFHVQEGTKHYKVSKDGRLISILPKGSGTNTARAVKNNLATLKANGFVWPPPAKPKPVVTAAKAAVVEDSFTRQIREFTEGRKERGEALAKLIGVSPRVIANYVRGHVKPNPTNRVLLEGYMQDHADHKPVLANKPPRNFDQKAYYKSMGFESYTQYEPVRLARKRLDREKLAAAMVAKGGDKIHASIEAGLSPSSVSTLRKSTPNLPSLRKMLMYLNRPMSDFAPGLNTSWPLGDKPPTPAPEQHSATELLEPKQVAAVQEERKAQGISMGLFRDELIALSVAMDAIDKLNDAQREWVVTALRQYYSLPPSKLRLEMTPFRD